MDMRGESSTKLPISVPPHLKTDHTVPHLNFSHHKHHSLHNHLPGSTRDPIPPSSVVTAVIQPPTLASHGRSVSRTPIQSSLTDNHSIPSSVRYRECLKNHAASTGGHVLDGCGEFMPGGEDGTLEAFRCAACECHRNFHRKETKDHDRIIIGNNVHRMDRTTPIPLSRHDRSPAVPIASMMMAFGGSNGAPEGSSSEDLNMYESNNGDRDRFGLHSRVMKKRFRTKFSKGQKEKMLEFGEKLRWKIEKEDESEVQQFCAEVGIRRQVFKVWMHNNKQAMKKKQM